MNENLRYYYVILRKINYYTAHHSMPPTLLYKELQYAWNKLSAEEKKHVVGLDVGSEPTPRPSN